MMNNQLSVISQETISPAKLWEKNSLFSNLDGLEGKRVIFRRDYSREQLSLEPALPHFDAKQAIREFAKEPRERIAIGIDSSCVLVGETEEGSIFAGRVATVYGSDKGVEKYVRAGPIIIYVNYDWLSGFSASIQKSKLRAIAQDDKIAERFIRICLERAAQLEAVSSLSDSIISIDGAIQRSSFELRETSLREIQRVALENSNDIVGLSKSSHIREISNATGILSSTKRGEIYIDITEIIRAMSDRVGSNKIVAAKFCPSSAVFRVDLSSSNLGEESQVLSDLKASDLFFRGYPETLRLAHHLSVFDPAIISSIRSYLSGRYNLIEVPSDDLRATVLGKLV